MRAERTIPVETAALSRGKGPLRGPRTSAVTLLLVFSFWGLAPDASAESKERQGASGPSAAVSGGESGRSGYVLQCGDELSISVFGRPELDDTVIVRPDGYISLPLVDEVNAAGLTPAQLDARLTEGLAVFYQQPRVTVIVRSFTSQRIYLGGEVANPGLIPLRGKLSALAAVFQAGGFKGTAQRSSVVLIRNSGHDTPAATVLNLEKVMNEGAPDIDLQPFDVLYVPMSKIARVNKFVDQYVRKLLPIQTVFGFQYILGKGAAVGVPQ